MSAPEPAEERTLGETYRDRAVRSPVVPPAAVVAGSGAGWTGSELGRTDGAILWRGGRWWSVLLTDSIQLSLAEGPNQNLLRGTFFCSFVFTLALFRTPFVYCWVYIHPQAFYKTYCTVFFGCCCIRMCYLLRALFTMTIHCVSTSSSFWNYLVLKEITRTQNLPDYNLRGLLWKWIRGKQQTPMLARSLDSQGFRRY